MHRSINAPTAVSRPPNFFGKRFPSPRSTEHLGSVCTKALLKTQVPRAPQRRCIASNSPSTQHVQKSAFQGSSTKERKRGKRSLCRSYKLHNSCHSMTTCSCLRSRQKPQHLQCEEVLTRYFALNKGLVQTELVLSDSDRTSVDRKRCAQAPAQIKKV